MLTDNIKMIVAESVKDAPNYTGNTEFKPVKLEKGIIVKNGTVAGNCTVDIQMTDQDGNKFVALVTGNLIGMMAAAIEGVNQRKEG